AWERASATVHESPFCWIVVSTRPWTLPLARAVDEIFTEVLIAPHFEPDALELLRRKKARRIVRWHPDAAPAKAPALRGVAGGLLVQDVDRAIEDPREAKVVTRRAPTAEELRALAFGGGGREHALVWKLRQSPRIAALYCAPGNAGIAEDAECVPIAADDVKGLLRFAAERRIDLTVVGPELPLTLGLVDRFTAAGLGAFGPTAAAARLEGSKAFTKELLRHERVPTAFFGVFGDPDDAARYVKEVGAPVVVKADGLASGKGVFICPTVAEALEAVDELMRARLFGDAGSRVVVEEF